MTEEPEEAAEPVKVQKKSLSIKQILIFGGIILVLAGGGFFTYTKFFAKHEEGKESKESAKDTGHKDKKPAEQILIPIEPLIVNLTDKSRFMKISLQLEVGDKKHEDIVKEKMPLLRDAIIMLLTSKSYETISGSDGKMQLKDEVLSRLNQALGKEIILNVYFTELMVQ
ncbi:flagellar basal body-associated FliL family protein [Candidatus Magnetominusculus dajiuhuensis]|uniref:flagellar basal body-associated FliL family protein n=1 Tax=Candidatus Magnetominusculus dajiuhuensis TaxID=3137712 RepID=UPI003B42AD36